MNFELWLLFLLVFFLCLNAQPLPGGVLQAATEKKICLQRPWWSTAEGNRCLILFTGSSHTPRWPPPGPGRTLLLLYVTWDSSLRSHGIWLTIQKTRQPGNSCQVLATSDWLELVIASSRKSPALNHEHIWHTMPGISTHTSTMNGSDMGSFE